MIYIIQFLIAIIFAFIILGISITIWGIFLMKFFKWYKTIRSLDINKYIGDIINIIKQKGREEDTFSNSGEKSVAGYLEKIVQPKYIINNIMINDNGKSRQIDHILIVEQGIFVIETKDYAGTIYGQEKWEEWQQYLGNRKFTFKNPVHQNYGHVQIVKKVLGLEEDITTIVKSLVVFTNRSKLKVNSITLVIQESEIANLIRILPKKIEQTQMKNAYDIIMANRITDKETIENHNYNVQQYVKYKEELLKDGICPRCYGKLVKRSSQYGEFWGCSNYPTCKYKKNIENKHCTK